MHAYGNKKYAIMIISIFVATILLITFLIVNNYLRGIRTDWEREIIARKSFFSEYKFSGKIIEREYKGDNYHFPYSLTIKLDTNVVLPR